MPWDDIVREWRGKVSKEAIVEALDLAREALVTTNDETRSAELPHLSVAG